MKQESGRTCSYMKMKDYKKMSDIMEGDILYRKNNGSFYTVRHIHEEVEKGNKISRIFEFDGFLVNQRAMRNMFEVEKFAEDSHTEKKVKIYKYI